MQTARKSRSDFPPNCHNSMADFFLPQSLFFQLRQFPGFNSNDQVTWVFLFPLKLQVFTLWKFTARLLLSLHFVPVRMATERTGPPSPGAPVPAGSLLGTVAGRQLWGSRAWPEHTCQGWGYLGWPWYLQGCRLPPACMKLCCLLSPLPLEA